MSFSSISSSLINRNISRGNASTRGQSKVSLFTEKNKNKSVQEERRVSITYIASKTKQEDEDTPPSTPILSYSPSVSRPSTPVQKSMSTSSSVALFREQNKDTDNFSRLPDDILFEIMSSLSTEDNLNLRFANKELYSISKNGTLQVKSQLQKIYSFYQTLESEEEKVSFINTNSRSIEDLVFSLFGFSCPIPLSQEELLSLKKGELVGRKLFYILEPDLLDFVRKAFTNIDDRITWNQIPIPGGDSLISGNLYFYYTNPMRPEPIFLHFFSNDYLTPKNFALQHAKKFLISTAMLGNMTWTRRILNINQIFQYENYWTPKVLLELLDAIRLDILSKFERIYRFLQYFHQKTSVEQQKILKETLPSHKKHPAWDEPPYYHYATNILQVVHLGERICAQESFAQLYENFKNSMCCISLLVELVVKQLATKKFDNKSIVYELKELLGPKEERSTCPRKSKDGFIVSDFGYNSLLDMEALFVEGMSILRERWYNKSEFININPEEDLPLPLAPWRPELLDALREQYERICPPPQEPETQITKKANNKNKNPCVIL